MACKFCFWSSQLLGWYADVEKSMVKEASNVIIRNLGVKKVLADNGDALAVRKYGNYPYNEGVLTK